MVLAQPLREGGRLNGHTLQSAATTNVHLTNHGREVAALGDISRGDGVIIGSGRDWAVGIRSTELLVFALRRAASGTW